MSNDRLKPRPSQNDRLKRSPTHKSCPRPLFSHVYGSHVYAHAERALRTLFSLCCTSSGEVYSWGSNRFGQCGFSSTASVSPRLIPNLKRQHIQAVACASQHSVAVNALGEVYTWGSNSHAQLGHGATASAPIKPGRVMTLNNSREGKKRVVFAVAASDTSTTVLARKVSHEHREHKPAFQRDTRVRLSTRVCGLPVARAKTAAIPWVYE